MGKGKNPIKVVESLEEAEAHSADSQVRTTTEPQEVVEALQRPESVQAYPVNLVEGRLFPGSVISVTSTTASVSGAGRRLECADVMNMSSRSPPTS